MSSEKSDIVVFLKSDPQDPKNWTDNQKRLVSVYVCSLAFCGVFGSSIYATAEPQIQSFFGVSAKVSSLGLTVYVLGFALGPLLWGPLSEMYGRKFPYLISWPLLIATSGISAWVNNLPTIIIFRLLAGCCAGCALNNGGGILSDMYNVVNMQGQAIAIAWYAACIFAGPCIALPLGFFIVAHAAPHLWPLRVFFFFVIGLWPLVIFLPETHGPTILAARSKRFRDEGRPNARAAHELKNQSKIGLFRSHIWRPAAMFFREPIIQGAAVWTSLAYGIVYFFFETYPVVYFNQHGFSLQLTGLPFLAMILGILTAALAYLKLVRFFQQIPMPAWIVPPETSNDSPESKLKLALFACCLMPISLFWFAWTSGERTHWLVSTLAGIPFGFAVICIFYTFLTYTSQTYTIYASSAGACNTFSRCLIASFFPVAAHTIIGNLGTKWGVSVFGFMSLALIPIPLAFLRYGAGLRTRSPYAQEANAIVAKMRAQAVAQAKAQAQTAEAQGSVLTNDSASPALGPERC